jgi:RecB family exonuclease
LSAEQWITESPVLAAYAAHGDAAFARLDDRPIAAPAHLSVGSIVQWLQCPRRLFYENFVGLRGKESDAQILGTALHDVFERFHAHETDFRRLADGDIERWTDQLLSLRRAIWNDLRFDSIAIREASAIFADRVLKGYARSLGLRVRETPFTVEAVECDVEVTIGPLRLRGRIDRIDRTSDGGLMLIDYKSGTAKEESFSKLLAAAATDWDANKSIAGTVNHDFVPQLAFYTSALTNVRAFTYLYLKGSKKAREDVALDTTSCDEATRGLIQRLLNDVRVNLADPLSAGRITAFRTATEKNSCRLCNFRAVCPGVAEDDE